MGIPRPGGNFVAPGKKRKHVILAHLVCVSVEGLDGLWFSQFAYVDTLVRAARRKALVRLPVDVERRGRVERKLLLVATGLRVPNDGRTIDT
jgi:hypothetical protein